MRTIEKLRHIRLASWAIMSFVILISSSNTQAAETVKEKQQIMCLAQNIYYEAGAESFDGKVAVAQVTVNRVESGNFPSTICGVVHQKTQVADKTICQFSWVCNTPGKIKYMSDRWMECIDVARNVIVNNLKLSQLDEALYFHNTHVNPQWGLERIAKIGNHIFYSDDPAPRKQALTRNNNGVILAAY